MRANDKTNLSSNPQSAGDQKSSTRRELLVSGGLLASAGIGAAWCAQAESSSAPPFQSSLYPVYYPQSNLAPELPLAGKTAVVTGASRGNGLATALALQGQGVTVYGTSRTPGAYSLPFPLLELDITTAASVDAFQTALIAALSGRSLDILINNAGRFVFGTPAPIDPSLAGLFDSQSALATETLYLGHVRVTNALLPLMPPTGYARLLYTVSVAGYNAGGTALGETFGQGFTHVYTSGKRALLAYANSMRGFLRSSGSTIKVSTVNPYAMNTALATGLNPIYLEPVDSAGNSSNPYLQAVLDGMRSFLSNGQPPSLVGDTYLQLLSQQEPVSNVVVGSPHEPYASMGASAVVNQLILEENAESALRVGAVLPKSR